ncbi:hypothetical protein [Candidatus Paracaedibacter symbiosus]|uniref:hypothetical protein n=1 Tax=Candidatus Paracaedibacter symbiosus TaxID=244582 RepID=UPI000509A43E|nr:hypothetical protein [Candidatus Paracaedibacter symbiosus]
MLTLLSLAILYVSNSGSIAAQEQQPYDTLSTFTFYQTENGCRWSNHDYGGLYLGTNHISLITKIEGENHNLCSLGFHGCELTDESSLPLWPILRSHSTLKSLDLSSNKLGTKSAINLRLLLEQSQLIESLNLQFNFFKAGDVAAIATGLAHNQSLKSLELGFNGVTDTDMETLAAALAHHKSLQKLGLSFLSLTPNQIQVLIRSIIKSQTLTDLNLSYNNMNESMYQLAALIHAKPQLTSLTLTHCNIGDQTAEKFYVQMNQYAETFSKDPVKKGFFSFFNGEEKKPFPQIIIDLRYNDLSDRGVYAFKAAFKKYQDSIQILY